MISVLLFLCFSHIPASAAVFEYAIVDAFTNLNLIKPLCIATPPGETNRLFVLEKTGNIVVITNLAQPNRTLFMSLTNLATLDEAGLLGIAFHPDYLINQHFYLFYTPTNSAGEMFNRISRFEADPSNPNHGLLESELPLVSQLDRDGHHNGGDLHFGPDGYLYASLGDEGGLNDIHHNSQVVTNNLFSGIIRLDVDKRSENLLPDPHPASSTNYFVPADNPFIGATQFNGQPVDPNTIRTEFWAVGLRNPWRFSFDSQTGFLYCGDVGQESREEIDVIVRGGNYGWNFREGSIARPGSPAPPSGFTSVNPIWDYQRTGNATNIGASVTGGIVYRGETIPQLSGDYVFGDYISGNIWALHYDGINVSQFRQLTREAGVVAFGSDPRTGDVLPVNFNKNKIQRLLYRPVLDTLTLNVNGIGTVSPNLNGQILQIGKTYSLTARAGANYIFSNWTGSVISSSPSLTFTMQTNMVLNANFVPNPFLAVAGIYNGLFIETNNLAHENSGFFTARITTNLGFSGKIVFDGNSVPVSGKFAVDGTATKTISRARFGKSDVQFNVALDFAAFDDILSGTISSSTWSSDLRADRMIWSTNHFAFSLTNSYTLLFPGMSPSTTAPGDFGYATVAVDKLGKTRLSGFGSDSAALAQSSIISKEGRWPFYVPLYRQIVVITNGATLITNKEERGSIFGWMSLTNTPHGTVTWIKTIGTNSPYAAGFTNQMETVGSIFLAPQSPTRILNFTNGLISLQEGNLPTALTNSFILSTNNTILPDLPNANKINASFNKKSGAFRGSFVWGDPTNRTTIFRGAVLQNLDLGGGFFLGTNQTGSVLLEPN